MEEQKPSEVFSVLEKIGHGSYGEVFKCEDKRDGQLCAVKLIPIDSDISQLEKEITILQDCKCENIVQYKGSFSDGEAVWVRFSHFNVGTKKTWLLIIHK